MPEPSAIDTWYAIWAIAKADGTTAGPCFYFCDGADPADRIHLQGTDWMGKDRPRHRNAVRHMAVRTRAQYVVGLAQTSALPIPISGTSGSVTVPNGLR